MTDEQSTRRIAGPLAAGLLLLILALAATYAAGYLMLGERREIGGIGAGIAGTTQVRAFRQKWLVTLYQPAAAIESVLVGERIKLVYEETFEVGEIHFFTD